nr:MAG TPA: hypothetical protein [Caudoviricetes sp.]
MWLASSPTEVRQCGARCIRLHTAVYCYEHCYCLHWQYLLNVYVHLLIV